MNIQAIEDKNLLYLSAVGQIVHHLNKAISEKGSASFVLAGGSTFTPVYRLLASEEYSNQVAWQKVSVYFGDERCVAPTDDRSNFKVAVDDWLSRFEGKEGAPTVYRMKGEDIPARAAKEYASLLPDRFDVTLLGIGNDGHTASLFPAEEERWSGDSPVVVVEAGLPPYVQRITLSQKALQNSDCIMVLVRGEEKTEIAQDAFYNHSKTYPINKVLEGVEGARVLIDQAVLPPTWFL